MARLVAVHSFRGGTGKSNTTANLAALLAVRGQRVGVVDTDIQSPGIQALFDVTEADIRYSLDDYLWGNCDIKQAALDMSERLPAATRGALFLVPSSSKVSDIARILREGYDTKLLKDGYRKLIQNLRLDTLFIDTHPGLNEETLFSIAIANTLLIMLRPDRQDYLGTGVTVEVARKLNVPQMLLVLNKVPLAFDPAEVKARVEQQYRCEVAGVLPHSDEMMILASDGLFALRYPDHPVTHTLEQVATRLMG